jgi:hypothetical protein
MMGVGTGEECGHKGQVLPDVMLSQIAFLQKPCPVVFRE